MCLCVRPLEDIEIATWAAKAKDMSERSALDIFGLGPAGSGRSL